MKILLLGSRGQVGWQLARSLSVVGDLTALHRESGSDHANLARPQALAATIRSLAPEVIVNAAAYTAVDRAETERDTAFAVNAESCEMLAAEARKLGAWLVHYSTDYVFDGGGERPWKETDPTGPLNVYGKSKLAGEQAVAAWQKHVVLRTSWVFDTWGQNFLKSILRAAAQRESLAVVSDQWGAPTRAALIADVTAHLLRRLAPETAGVYHLAAAGETNWHAYAQLAIDEAFKCGMTMKTSPDKVRPISTADYPTAAARPYNSRLDTARLRSTFDLCLPAWQDGVRGVVAELAALRKD
jgi:dTDP-4-dehydrorhamnose reductase